MWNQILGCANDGRCCPLESSVWNCIAEKCQTSLLLLHLLLLLCPLWCSLTDRCVKLLLPTLQCDSNDSYQELKSEKQEGKIHCLWWHLNVFQRTCCSGGAFFSHKSGFFLFVIRGAGAGQGGVGAFFYGRGGGGTKETRQKPERCKLHF